MRHAYTEDQVVEQITTGLFSELLAATKSELRNAECEWQRIVSTDAPDFRAVSIFSPDENRLSRAIAELLNPSGTHGQGDEFLKLFLQRLPTVKTGNLSKSEVQREACTYTIARQKRRIDILAKGKNPAWGVGIENKPWAGEQNEQLRDYTEHLKNQFGQNFVLLRIAGADGEPTSLDTITCKTMSAEGKFCTWRYHVELASWLEDCGRRCKSPRVVTFIDELTRYIGVEFGNRPTNVLNFMTQKLIPVLEKLLAEDAGHIRAFAEAVEAFPVLRHHWVTDLFNEVKTRVEQKLGAGWHADWDPDPFVETNYAKFRVWHDTWGSWYRICLESQPKERRVILGIQHRQNLRRDSKVCSELKRLGWGDDPANEEWWEGCSPLEEPFTDWTAPSTVAFLGGHRSELEEIIVQGVVAIGTQVKDRLSKLARDFEGRKDIPGLRGNHVPA
jgi:hypothetical protein